MRADGKNWEPLTSRAAEWEIPRAVQAEDQNWAGLQKMREDRAAGSLWWDDSAEQHFISKLERSQFPADCSQAHWIVHPEWTAGLLSTVHMFLLPLFFAMVRGHTLVSISDAKTHRAFDGCGPTLSHLNLQCFFNVTHCNPAEDLSKLSRILDVRKESKRMTWDELLMAEDCYFSPGDFTVIRSWKHPAWTTDVCIPSSSFSSYVEAFTYYKFSLWNEMRVHGKVGVVTGPISDTCPSSEQDSSTRRVELVITALMASWMMNRVPNSVKLVAHEIMSRYTDKSGQPLWKSPLLFIHIRQTDKLKEDPYFLEHGIYRPVEDYTMRMKQMEEQYGFQWPSIFLSSDSGTAVESLIKCINGNDSAAPQWDKRYIMYDWAADDHLIEKYNHDNVPRLLKHDMQTHFLATLYILQKLADHAIVTYSSNVGRFIGEIMTAKHKQAFVDTEGPFVTSLDDIWVWHYDLVGWN